MPQSESFMPTSKAGSWEEHSTILHLSWKSQHISNQPTLQQRKWSRFFIRQNQSEIGRARKLTVFSALWETEADCLCQQLLGDGHQLKNPTTSTSCLPTEPCLRLVSLLMAITFGVQVFSTSTNLHTSHIWAFKSILRLLLKTLHSIIPIQSKLWIKPKICQSMLSEISKKESIFTWLGLKSD